MKKKWADRFTNERQCSWPLAIKSVAAKWKAGFAPADPKDQIRPVALNTLQAYLAALHDLAPSLYVIYRLGEMSSNDDVLLLDFVRPQVIRAMGDALVRLAMLRATELNAVQVFTDLASKVLASQGRLEDAAKLLVNGPGIKREGGHTIKPVKSLVDPIFLQNLDFLAAHVSPLTQQAFAAAFHLAEEISRDAYDYSLAPPTIVSRGVSQTVIPGQARSIMQLCDALYPVRAEDYHGSFNFTRIALNIGADWLLMRTSYTKSLEEMAANAYEDISEAAAFKAQEDETHRELESILAQNAGAQVGVLPGFLLFLSNTVC